MRTNQNGYYSLSDYFKDEFGKKIYKVSLDGGFTCPNRDGKVGVNGCIFCSEKGSGEFTGKRESTIVNQIEEQLRFLDKKIGDSPVIAYFQNFTNTYGDIEYLRKIYYEALSHPRVIGIAIATRPDCLEEPVLALLDEINKKHYLWIELGLQTSNDEIAKVINRGFNFDKYKEVALKLNQREIKFVTHMIIGLPFESRESIIKTAEDIIKANSWGIKIHSLYILKDSILQKIYEKKEFWIPTLDEYTDLVVEILKKLPKNMVVHRLTGDGVKESVVAPLWSLNKRQVLNEIVKKLRGENPNL